MIRILFFGGLVLAVYGAPVSDDAQAKIVSFENESDGKGNYHFSFETSNGIFRRESGEVMNEGKPDQYIFVEGSVTFTDPDGNVVSFRYVADQNGYEVLPPPATAVLTSVSANLVATLLG